jgi:hypothetical protein
MQCCSSIPCGGEILHHLWVNIQGIGSLPHISQDLQCHLWSTSLLFNPLGAALDMQLLPTHMTEWRYVLIGKGAVMIEELQQANCPRCSVTNVRSLVSLCTTLVAKYLPESKLCQWLCKLSRGTAASQVLTVSIEWLRGLTKLRKDKYTPQKSTW